MKYNSVFSLQPNTIRTSVVLNDILTVLVVKNKNTNAYEKTLHSSFSYNYLLSLLKRGVWTNLSVT
jgi:hypothetical protein